MDFGPADAPLIIKELLLPPRGGLNAYRKRTQEKVTKLRYVSNLSCPSIANEASPLLTPPLLPTSLWLPVPAEEFWSAVLPSSAAKRPLRTVRTAAERLSTTASSRHHAHSSFVTFLKKIAAAPSVPRSHRHKHPPSTASRPPHRATQKRKEYIRAQRGRTSRQRPLA